MFISTKGIRSMHTLMTLVMLGVSLMGIGVSFYGMVGRNFTAAQSAVASGTFFIFMCTACVMLYSITH